ncbi:MAG: glycoside hydrolase family 3 N-terminal domain-containing protein, partial [Caldilineaceae bacterium]
EEILAGMSAADRVGQLFVVTFRGADTSFESAIAELIYAYRVGGVMLGAENGNFSNEPGANTARQVAELTNKLQGLAYGILLPTEHALQPVPNEPWPPGNLVSLEREIGVAPPNLPLLIGVEQLGDNLQGTALRRGFSPLPSQLAVGSTWDPETARLVGETAGRELRAVGINLLLGPILDVVDVPRSDEVGSLSVHSFGGNPSWVGRMGRAYIGGVHEGSSGRVATVSRHFPGQGDIDRLPDAEVATIQRTLAELEQIAIPPFLAVTRPQIAPAPDEAASISAAPAAAESAAAESTAAESDEGGDADAAVVTATTGITSSDALSASVVLSGGESLTATAGVGETPTGVPASTPPPAY